MNALKHLCELGQSPWYDYITRDLITSGELERLIEEDGLRGMTTNPTIFEKAVSGSALYDEDLEREARNRKSPEAIFEAIAVDDVRAACEAFRSVHDATDGADGLVSIEVAPALARDTDGTIEAVHRIWEAVDRPNVMVKIPGTLEGLPAIERCLTDGINVNITLLFSVDRYLQVVDRFLSALEQRVQRGQRVDRIASVASFFVSRVDTKVDARLDEIEEDHELRGTIGIANACRAYAEFRKVLESDRWKRLADAGAKPQRPLWASTSTKDDRYSDVHYVEALIAPLTVNTLPPHTFDAYRDHGEPEVRIDQGIRAAPDRLERLAALGIDLEEVTEQLEDEGVQKFADSYDGLLEGIAAKVQKLGVEAVPST